jgi:hypothetical protein
MSNEMDYEEAKREVARALNALLLEAPAVVVRDVRQRVEVAFRLADEEIMRLSVPDDVNAWVTGAVPGTAV